MTSRSEHGEELAAIRRDLVGLHEDASPEMAADLLVRIESAAAQMRELRHQCEERLLDWIERNGAIEIGTIRYVAGTKKTVKVRDVGAAMREVLRVALSEDDVLAVLSTSALKPAATRELIGQPAFDELFETRIERDLVGKPVREMKRLDTRFTKGAA